MISTELALDIVEALRKGQPPQQGVHKYSVGHEFLLEGIQKHHMDRAQKNGIIRFLSGSSGAGKTHIFRLIRDLAFANNYLVSNVELSRDEATLNKFEQVVAAIVRNIRTPTHDRTSSYPAMTPFGRVLYEGLVYLALGTHLTKIPLTEEHYETAEQKLMSDTSIDIDFRKLVARYWQTYFPDRPTGGHPDTLRGEILQWFVGEGELATYRRQFFVNKMVTRETAKLIFESLAAFAKLAGYRGIFMLFDEMQESYSTMGKVNLKRAHDNLLSLMNNIDPWGGLFLLYATTPAFYNDERHGIVTHSALSSRIGQPKEHQSPNALDLVWNLDVETTDLMGYQRGARNIREIYLVAYPDASSTVPSAKDVDREVKKLHEDRVEADEHRFWRVMVTTLMIHFDDHVAGRPRSIEDARDDAMERLLEQ